jgi:hypothetical protein
VSFASKHIGSASGRGNTKGKVSGLGANTGKSGKPVVTAEQGMAEALGDLRPKLGSKRDQGKSVRKWRQARGMDESGVAEGRNNSCKSIFESIGQGDTYFTRWEKEIHPVLCEVALSSDQIQQIFTAAEKGSDRTLLGKGLDAAGKISDVWFNKFGGMLQNSTPVKAFDAQYDKIVSKIAVKHPDIAAKVKKYQAWAKENPNLQKFLLAIAGSVAASLGVVAAGGIAAGALAIGTGTAIAVGIVNIADRLLKGEKASTAIGRGATAGAVAGLTAAGISKAKDILDTLGVVKTIKNFDVIEINGTTVMLTPEDAAKYSASAQASMKATGDLLKGGGSGISSLGSVMDANAAKQASVLADILSRAADPEYQKAVAAAANQVIEPGVVDAATNAVLSVLSVLNPVLSAISGQAAGSAREKPAAMKESVTLSESQIFLMIGKIVERQRKLDEGIMDTIKGAAGKAANYVRTKGTNLTTKITADKLLQAWKKADSPTDSETVAKVMQSAGVPETSVQQVYNTMRIPFLNWDEETGAPISATAKAEYEKFSPEKKAEIEKLIADKQNAAGPGDPTPLLSPAQLAARRDPAASGPGNPTPLLSPAQLAAKRDPAAPTAAAPAAPAAAAGKFPGEDPQGSNYVGRREVARRQAARDAGAAKPAPAKTPDYSRQSTGYSGTTYTMKQPAAPAAQPGIPSTGTSNSVFGRTSTSSTGGISQPTATGLRHTAKANNPNQPAVAEAARQGEYGRVLTALGLYYPDKFSMEELNTPGWHKVIANKAEVPVEYAGQVINDFTRPGVDDEDNEQDLNEFAPGSDNDGNDGFSDDTLRQLAAQWYNGDEDPKVERTLMAAGWEIGQDEGYDDTPGVFVVQTGDVNGRSYMSWPAPELERLSESAGDELESILKSAGLVRYR